MWLLKMLYWYNAWPSCWGNYSFALGLTFRPTLLGFFLHMVDVSPQGVAVVQGSGKGAAGREEELRQFLKWNWGWRWKLALRAQPPASWRVFFVSLWWCRLHRTWSWALSPSWRIQFSDADCIAVMLWGAPPGSQLRSPDGDSTSTEKSLPVLSAQWPLTAFRLCEAACRGRCT